MRLIRKNSKKELDKSELEENCDVIIGGDFNVTLDADLDGTIYIDLHSEKKKIKNKHTEKKNNKAAPFGFNLWLINSTIQVEAENVDIIPAIWTDHSAI